MLLFRQRAAAPSHQSCACIPRTLLLTCHAFSKSRPSYPSDRPPGKRRLFPYEPDNLQLASLNDLLEMCAPSLLLTVGSRRLRVGRLLGEGGYAYVYAATDAATGRQYALKKMRCPDSERLANARREIGASRCRITRAQARREARAA